jgi:hypothetical protein
VPASPLVDLTTTSVGRTTIIDTYESFLAKVRFSGRFRVLVTVDPAYGVEADEVARTLAYLDDLPDLHPVVESVTVERFPRQVGLAVALRVLLAMSSAEYGVYIGDDWECTGEVDLDRLLLDLEQSDSREIVLSNSHVVWAARSPGRARPSGYSAPASPCSA